MKRRKFKETKIKPRERKIKRRRNPKRTRSTRKSSTVTMKSKNPKEEKENTIMMNLTNLMIKMLNMKGKDHTIMVNTKRTLNARGMILQKVNHQMKKGSILKSVLIHRLKAILRKLSVSIEWMKGQKKEDRGMIQNE